MTTLIAVLYVLILVLLFVFCFSLSVLENALTSCNLASLNLISRTNQKYAKKYKQIQLLLANYSGILTIIVAFNNLCAIIASSLVTEISIHLNFPAWGTVLAIVMVSIIYIGAGEIFPKNWARSKPEKSLIRFLKFGLAVWYITKPLIYLIEFLFRSFKTKNHVSKDHLLEWVKISEKDKQISNSARVMIESTIIFDKKIVRKSMQPISSAIFLYSSNSISENIAICEKEQFSRYVLLDKKLKPKGIIIASDLMSLWIKNKCKNISNFNYNKILNSLVILKDDSKLSEALDILRRQRQHLALVENDNKKIVGIISMEDLIEEIVGNIYDEDETYSIMEFGNKHYLVGCNANISNVFKNYFSRIKKPETKHIVFFNWIRELNGNIDIVINQNFKYKNLSITYKQAIDGLWYFDVMIVTKEKHS